MFGQAWPAVAVDTTSPVTTSPVTTTSGSTVVVFVAANSLTFAAGMITDSKGNTYSFVSNLTGPQFGYKCGLYYCENIVGGAGHTITCVNPDGTLAMSAVELTTMQAASFDGTQSGSGTSASLSSGNITTTATDTLVGCGMIELGTAGTFTATGGFTARVTAAPALFVHTMLETKDAVPSGSVGATETYSQSTDGWVMRAIAFKESSGGGGGGGQALYESSYSVLEPQTNPLTISQW